jgi:predicted TIM-barrel fold metal-dependent hydrolase
MWASDYPHTDSTFPESRKAIRENFGSIPAEVTRKIVYSNVSRLYQLDLDQ